MRVVELRGQERASLNSMPGVTYLVVPRDDCSSAIVAFTWFGLWTRIEDLLQGGGVHPGALDDSADGLLNRFEILIDDSRASLRLLVHAAGKLDRVTEVVGDILLRENFHSDPILPGDGDL